MKMAYYDLHFVEPDGSGLIIGGFHSKEKAEAFPKDWEHATFERLEKRLVEVKQEDVFRIACVVCGCPVGSYQTSWREPDAPLMVGRRACSTCPRPTGFKAYTDG